MLTKGRAALGKCEGQGFTGAGTAWPAADAAGPTHRPSRPVPPPPVHVSAGPDPLTGPAQGSGPVLGVVPDATTLFTLPSDAVAHTADDCYTPRWVFDAMGLEFDLDAAAPFGGPLHVPCARYYTAADDGLAQPWDGLTWCNPPYSKFGPWAHKWTTTPRACLMGTYTPGTAWFPHVFAAADAVAFITCEFLRPELPPIRPMHGLFVAFRGVGAEPAERLAAADRFGAVLYGTAA